MRCAARSIWPSADASHSGRPVISAPARSASNSRRARDRRLHQHGGDGRQQGHQQHADHAQRMFAVAAAAHEEGHVGQHGNGARDHRGDGHGQGIAMLHMAQLMRQHARQFFLAHLGQQAGGDADRGMIGIAPGGKGVGLRIFGDVDLGHGQLRLRRQLLHQAVKLAARWRHRPGARHTWTAAPCRNSNRRTGSSPAPWQRRSACRCRRRAARRPPGTARSAPPSGCRYEAYSSFFS